MCSHGSSSPQVNSRNQVFLKPCFDSWTKFPNGFPLTLCILVEEPTKEFTLPASATKTSISDLSPDVDYVVTISAYAGSEESLPISGQITRESPCPRLCVCVCKLAPDIQPDANKSLSAAGLVWQGVTMMTICFSLKPKLTGRIAKDPVYWVDKITGTPYNVWWTRVCFCYTVRPLVVIISALQHSTALGMNEILQCLK